MTIARAEQEKRPSYAIVAADRTLFRAALALQGLLARHRFDSHVLPEGTAHRQLDQATVDRYRDIGMQALIIVERAGQLPTEGDNSTYGLQKLGHEYPEGMRTVTVGGPAAFDPVRYGGIEASCDSLVLAAEDPELVDPDLASALAGRVLIMAMRTWRELPTLTATL